MPVRVGLKVRSVWLGNLDRRELCCVCNFFEADPKSVKNMHHFMYHFENRGPFLKAVGFTVVSRYEYRQAHCPDVDKLDNRPESLFVEAIN